MKLQTFHLHSASFRMCLILLPQEISSKTFNTDHSGAQRSHTDQHRNLVGGNHSFLSEWIQIPLPSRIGAIKHTLRSHLGLHIRLQSTVSHGDLLFLPVILRINCNKVNSFCIYFNISRYKYTASVLKYHNAIHSVEHRMFSCTKILFMSIKLYWNMYDVFFKIFALKIRAQVVFMDLLSLYLQPLSAGIFNFCTSEMPWIILAIQTGIVHRFPHFRQANDQNSTLK